MGAVAEGRLGRKFAAVGVGTDKPIVTTLQCPNLRPARRCGNSTRQINFAIEQLFEGYAVICLDHLEHGENIRANDALFERVVRRFNNENPGVIGTDFIVVNRLHGFLYLKNEELCR